MPAHPTDQVRDYPLEPDDPVTTEWTVIVTNSSGVEGLFGRQHPDSTDYDAVGSNHRDMILTAAPPLIERMHTTAPAQPSSMPQ